MASEQKHSPKLMVLAAFVGNGLIMIMKFVVGLLSGSAAMLAEAVHSLADTFNQVFLLISLKLGEKPADEEHPYGHGKERFFWAFLTAVIIFFVGAFFSIFEGVKKLFESGHASSEAHLLLSLIILGIAFIFEAGSLSVAVYEVRHTMKIAKKKRFREFIANTKDLTLKTVIFEDGAALVGLIVAAAGLYLTMITGSAIYDGLASIVIGLVLAVVAIYLAKESRELLIGHSASREDMNTIYAACISEPEVEQIVDLSTMHLGPDEILLTAHLQIHDALSSKQQVDLIDRIEKKVRTKCPKVKRIFIEPEFAEHEEKVLTGNKV